VPQTLQPIEELQGHSDAVAGMLFFDTTLWSAARDDMIAIWQTSSL